ncbi:MAG: extracellular solute-binding protein, partial [Chloroflexi bacterium]
LQQFAAFQADHPDLRVEVVLKKPYGPGGLLDYLRTAKPVAPSLLPDLMVLDAAELPTAAREGLVQPLDGLIPSQLLTDLFPFAARLGEVDGVWVGVPYQAELQHLVYDTTKLERPPMSWRDVYSSTTPFLFATGTPRGGLNDVLVNQYLALGGRLVDEEGRPVIDREPLVEALTFFNRGRKLGVIPYRVLNLSNAASVWTRFLAGEAGMAQLPATFFLMERDQLAHVGFAPVPTRNRQIAPLGRGWVLAVVTSDPERQKLAALLLEWLMEPENNGAWSRAAGRLPARRASLEMWDQDDAYVPFIRQHLERAVAAPPPEVEQVLAPPLQTALRNVLRGVSTPEEAAEEAIATVEGRR